MGWGRWDTDMLAALERCQPVPRSPSTTSLGRWYRYHTRSRMHFPLAPVAPDRVHGLHRAAARWYAKHGTPDHAITHAVAGPPENAADLIERALPED